MNFLDILATNLGVDLAGCDTDEKKLAAIMVKINTLKSEATAGISLMGKLNAKTAEEALATIATMVPRDEHTKTQNDLASADLKLVLLEGQMSGKLSAADCDPEKGWAFSAAKQAPQVLRGMLSVMPPKVATGQAIQSVVAGLQTVVRTDADTAVKTITVNDHKYGLTAITKDYGDKDLANLRDMVGRFGVQAMVAQGYIVEL